MNKRIQKKLENRMYIFHYKEFKEFKEFLKSLNNKLAILKKYKKEDPLALSHCLGESKWR